MCVSIPGRVLSFEGEKAVLDVLGARRTARVAIPGVKVGDYVLTSAGLILEVLDEEEAQATIALFEELMALGIEEEPQE